MSANAIERTANIAQFPIHTTEPINGNPKFAWYIRFGLYIGCLMTQPANPKGWGWNPSVLGLCLIVAGILTSGGYYIGHQAAMIENLEHNQSETKAVADDAHTKATYAISKADGGDGHEPSNKAANTPAKTPKKEK